MKKILISLTLALTFSLFFVNFSFAELDKKEINQLIEKADGGDAEAQYNLGIFYKNARGMKKNNEMAFRYFKLSADQGHANAQYRVGVMYYNGQGVNKKISEALKYYRLSAEQGNTKAQYNLSIMYQEGSGVRQSREKALRYYELLVNKFSKLATEQKDAEAQYYLGKMYQEGRGVMSDEKKAIEYYKLAAEQGDVNAQLNLGFIYYLGKSVSYNRDVAQFFFKKVCTYGEEESCDEIIKFLKSLAEKEYLDAQYELAVRYRIGYGVKQDQEESEKYYKLATEQFFEISEQTSHSAAQEFLAQILYLGKLVEKDHEDIIEFFKSPEKQKTIQTQLNLETIYEKKKLEPNYEYVFKNFKLLADQGYPWAQFFLGSLYENGSGVEVNYSAAKDLYRKACDKGYQNGCDWYNILNKKGY